MKTVIPDAEINAALKDAVRLDCHQRSECERIRLHLIAEAGRGLADVATGRVNDARQVVQRLKHR